MTTKASSKKETGAPLGKGNTMYEVGVSGTYFSASENGTGNTVKNYDVKVNIPESLMPCALSHIKNHLLEPALIKLDPGYKGFRTHFITGVINLDDPAEEVTSPQFMSKGALLKFIDKKELPVQPHLYPMLEDLRQAVIACRDDEEAFLANQAHHKEFHEAEILTQTALVEANPDLFE